MRIDREVVRTVRTVQAFAGEEKAVKSYRTALQNTYKYGRKGGLAKGLGLGSLHCILFLSWALLVWFTSVVVHKGISNGGESFTTMLNVIISGLVSKEFYAPALGGIMLSIGIKLSINDFALAFQRHLPLSVGYVAQYMIKLLFGLMIAKAFKVPSEFYAGFILTSCVAGAQLSSYANKF